MTTPLHLPSNKKSTSGLFIYCGKCRTLVGKVCKDNDKTPISKCKFSDRHKYKVVYYASPTERRTKILETRDYDTAVQQAIEFKKKIRGQVEEKNLSDALEIIVPQDKIEEVRQEIHTQEPEKEYNLTSLMARYIGFLSGDPEIVVSFRRRVRSKKHIQDTARVFKYFAIALKKKNYPVESMRVDAVTEKMIECFHDALLERKFSNSSYNKAFVIFTSFYNYLIGEGYEIRNPFKIIPRRAISTGKSQTINREEWERLLEIIKKPELGVETLSNGRKKYYFKRWLGDCFKISLYTGRRNFEISRMTFADIFEDKDGTLLYIRTEDYKINNQRGIAEDDIEHKKHIYIPIHDALRSLLIQLGYERYKGTGRYLVAGDEEMDRDTVKVLMSRAFTHYYKQLNTGKDLSFKCFRKTYISQLSGFMGIDNARIITSHSQTKVMSDFYINHKYISLTAKNFQLFKENKDGRQTDLDNARGTKEGFSPER